MDFNQIDTEQPQYPAVDDSKSADFMTRLKMSFAKDDTAKAHALASRFGKENVFVVDDPNSDYRGQLAFRDPKTGSFHPADENNFTLKDYADWVGSVPEMATSILGGMAGAVVGTPAGPGGMAGAAMIGAGTGGGAGEYIRHSIANAMGLPEGNSEDVAKGIRNAAIVNTLGEGGGQAINGIMKAGARFATPTLAEKGTQELFEQNNMPYLLSDVKKSKPLALVESALSNMPTSSDVYHDVALRQLEQYGVLGEKALERAGGATSDVMAGEAAKQGLKDKAAFFSKATRPLYEKVGELMDGVSAPPSNTLSTMQRLRDETKIGRSGELESIFKDIESALDESGGNLSYRALDQASSRIGAKAQSGTAKMDADGRLFSILNNAIKSDMAQMVESSGIKDAKRIHDEADFIYTNGLSGKKEAQIYNQANRGFNNSVKLPTTGLPGDDLPAREVFDKTTAKAMHNTESGAKILDMIKPKDTEGILRQRMLVGEDAWKKDIAPAWLTKNLEGLEGKLTKEGVEVTFTSPDKFVSWMGKWDSNLKGTRKSALDMILPQQTVEQLRNMEKLARNTNTANKLASNYSGTARVSGAMDLINKTMQAPATILLPVGQAALAGGAAYGTAKDWDESSVMGKVVDGAALASVLIGPRILAKKLTSPATLAKFGQSTLATSPSFNAAVDALAATPKAGAGFMSTRKLRSFDYKDEEGR